MKNIYPFFWLLLVFLRHKPTPLILTCPARLTCFIFRPIYQEFARLHTVYGTEQL